MRRFREIIAIAFAAGAVSALSAQEARQVVERGMKARCDSLELLTKQRTEIIALNGKIFSPAEKDATGEIQADWPSSFRWERTIVDPLTKEKNRQCFAVRIDKGWVQLEQLPPVDIGLTEIDDYRTEMYGRWLATLYPLKDKAFTLTLLKDNRVADEEVSVVKAALAFRPDVYLSFSKKSGHLLKVAYHARENGAEHRKEHLFSDYKEFDGIKLPARMIDMRQVGTGTSVKAAEWTITNYKFVEKMSPEVFDKPAAKK